jgi:hypothetical protein
VAVTADDLALLDLGEDVGPRIVRELGSDVEALVAKVVELQHDWVGLAAVDARMLREVLEEKLRPFSPELGLPALRSRDVSRTISQVVLTPVRGLAGATVMLPHPLGATMPSELIE